MTADGTQTAGWQVVENITGRPVSQTFSTEQSAIWACRGLNIEAGPGGRYGVREVSGDPPDSCEGEGEGEGDSLSPDEYAAGMLRTCDDCGAEPGEACAWSCSSRWR